MHACTPSASKFVLICRGAHPPLYYYALHNSHNSWHNSSTGLSVVAGGAQTHISYSSRGLQRLQSPKEIGKSTGRLTFACRWPDLSERIISIINTSYYHANRWGKSTTGLNEKDGFKMNNVTACWGLPGLPSTVTTTRI